MNVGGLSGAWNGMQRLQPPSREELLRQNEAREDSGTAASELRAMRPDAPAEVTDIGTQPPGARLADADGPEDTGSTGPGARAQAAALQQAESTLVFASQRAGAEVDAAQSLDDAAVQAAGGRVERNFPWLPNAASDAALKGDGQPDTGTDTARVDAAPTLAQFSEVPAPAQGPGATAQEAAPQALATADADGDQRLDAGEVATPQGAQGLALNPALAAAGPAAQAGPDAAQALAPASPSSALPLREGGLDAQAERLAALVVQQYAAAGGHAVPGVGQQVNTSA